MKTRGRRFLGLAALINVLAVLLEAWLEFRSFESTSDTTLLTLQRVVVPCFILGQGMAVVGSVFLIRQSSPRELLGWGIGVVAICTLGWWLTPMNVHRWTVVLLLVEVCGFAFGLTYILAGLIKRASMGRLIRADRGGRSSG